MEKVSGRIQHVIFHNETNYFTVARVVLNTKDEKLILVTGHFNNIDKDFLYHLEGEYVEHPKYGMQFKVYHVQKASPTDKDSLIRYFSSPIFPGIGHKMAVTLVETLGDEAIEKIKADSSCLDDVEKMTLKKKESLVDGILSNDDYFGEITKYFMQHGLGIRNIIRLNHAYGKETIQKISENPYRVIEEIDGFGFKTADKIALSMGFDLDHPLRLEALLSSTLMQLCMTTGDSYVQKETLKKIFLENIPPTAISFDELVKNLASRRQLVEEENRVYPISQYDSEQGIASFLSRFPFEKLDPYNQENFENSLGRVQQKLNIQYDQKQIEAIQCFFENDIMILTGGPGTGKTTVVRGMISIFKELYPQAIIACCAPTGRAAKRLSELTEVNAFTIHSLLQWNLETNTFGKNKEEPLFVDLLVIDEFSMVDHWLFYNLIIAGAHIKKICLIGDENQLSSVSPGCILKDVIESKLFPVIELVHIFRQKEGSDVVELSAQIREGYFDFSILKKDVAFFPCNQYGVKERVIHIVKQALERGFELKDIQVLACMYGGVAGIDNLNNALQACFNPPSSDRREWKVGFRTYREGDKILQLKNLPDDNVYNGDIGTLIDIIYPSENESKKVEFLIDFDGVFVEYTPEQFELISHAYCISVHKSQGSEYPLVIMPVVKSYHRMLQRRLIYTGITRAKKSLILIGEKEAIQKGVDQVELHQRKTTLQQRLKRSWLD